MTLLVPRPDFPERFKQRTRVCGQRTVSKGPHNSFADPVPRRTASGVLVMPGHVGTIYAATNAVYAGRATARTVKLLPDGTVFNIGVRAGSRGPPGGREFASQLVDRPVWVFHSLV